MWSIRVLSGSQAGKTFELKDGKNVIGRSSGCDIIVQHNGVSKNHAEITVYNDKIIVADLNSSNGTFVNGIRIQNSLINVGDKIGLYDMLIDVFPTQNQLVAGPGAQLPQQMPAANMMMPNDGAVAVDLYQQPNTDMTQAQPVENAPQPTNAINARVQNYIENVALPGIYKLPEVTDYKVVIGGMIFLVIVAVSALSIVPLMRITSDSIEQESRRRALSLARGLANQNQSALAQGMEGSLSTNQIQIEEGVKNALIIKQSNGTIIAPPKLAGEHPDLPFVATARLEKRELVKMIGSGQIGASVPISFYDPELGQPKIRYHAIVLYDMGSIALNDEHTLSLFIQVLVLALFFGAVILFFMIKLIEYPFVQLNTALSQAIQRGTDNIEINFQLPVFQDLISNVNTMLNRALYGDGQQSGGGVNKESEAENLIQLIGFPSMAVNKEGYIIGVNIQFENFINKSSAEMQNQTIQSVPDQALQLSIGDLMDRSSKQPELIASNELDFSGETFLISCQAILNTDGEIEYSIITVSPLMQEEYE